jgi:hypothetical protein
MKIFVSMLMLLWCAAGYAETASVIDNARANLRTGKGENYRFLRVLPPKTEVEIIETSDDYTKVKTAEGQTGWVKSSLLGAPVPTPKAEATQQTAPPPDLLRSEGIAGSARGTGENAERTGNGAGARRRGTPARHPVPGCPGCLCRRRTDRRTGVAGLLHTTSSWIENMKLAVFFCFLCMFMVFAAQSAQSATMYRWIDAQGKVHYTDQPPPAEVRDVTEKKLSAPAQASSQTPTPPRPPCVIFGYPVRQQLRRHLQPRTRDLNARSVPFSEDPPTRPSPMP